MADDARETAAALVGESLMRAPDPAQLIAAFRQA